jgi:integrase
VASYIKRGDRWRAQVRRVGRKPIVMSFPTKAAAKEWAEEIEAQLDAGGAYRPATGGTIADLIETYRGLRDAARPVLDTSNEHYMLKRLAEGLGEIKVAALTVDDLIAWCKRRRVEGAGPYTVNMDISKLGTVFRYTSEGLPDVVGAARPKLSYLGLIGGGGKRERRPTDDEFERLLLAAPEWLADVLLFAVATAMRRGEIVRLCWADLDEERRVVWVRNRKHPRKKEGNDDAVPLLNGALEVLLRQRGRDPERCFPYHETTVSKAFTYLCRDLGIPDLHFHDLRHEGTSRLFEQGYQIQQVALVTGHRDWKHLQRYTNLRPEDLHKKP